MRETIKIYAIPLWPLVKNTFILSLVLFTVLAVVGGFVWFGFLKMFASYMPEYGMQQDMQVFQNMGTLFVIFFAIFYGIISSALFTFVVGLGGVLYNAINRNNGGFEFEISLPDFISQPEVEKMIDHKLEKRVESGSAEAEQKSGSSSGNGE